MDIKLVNPKRGTLPAIAKAFRLTTACVSQHLHGRTNNSLSQLIRKAALQMGGTEYEKIIINRKSNI